MGCCNYRRVVNFANFIMAANFVKKILAAFCELFFSQESYDVFVLSQQFCEPNFVHDSEQGLLYLYYKVSKTTVWTQWSEQWSINVKKRQYSHEWCKHTYAKFAGSETWWAVFSKLKTKDILKLGRLLWLNKNYNSKLKTNEITQQGNPSGLYRDVARANACSKTRANGAYIQYFGAWALGQKHS